MGCETPLDYVLQSIEAVSGVRGLLAYELDSTRNVCCLVFCLGLGWGHSCPYLGVVIVVGYRPGAARDSVLVIPSCDCESRARAVSR